MVSCSEAFWDSFFVRMHEIIFVPMRYLCNANPWWWSELPCYPRSSSLSQECRSNSVESLGSGVSFPCAFHCLMPCCLTCLAVSLPCFTLWIWRRAFIDFQAMCVLCVSKKNLLVGHEFHSESERGVYWGWLCVHGSTLCLFDAASSAVTMLKTWTEDLGWRPGLSIPFLSSLRGSWTIPQ